MRPGDRFALLGEMLVEAGLIDDIGLNVLEGGDCTCKGRQLDQDDLARAQTRRLNQNCARLLQMRALVDDGYRVLTGTGSLAPFGELLHESWMLKRELDRRVSNAHIDRWYREGIDAGAIGGKLLGAGAGGFLLFFAPPETHDFIRARLAELVDSLVAHHGQLLQPA